MSEGRWLLGGVERFCNQSLSEGDKVPRPSFRYRDAKAFGYARNSHVKPFRPPGECGLLRNPLLQRVVFSDERSKGTDSCEV